MAKQHMENLERRIRGLSPDKRQLLAQQMERLQPAPATLDARSRSEREGSLVVYVEIPAHARTTATPDALRVQLQQRVPDYMVPSSICVLDTLPRTGSGKVDRRQLPNPTESRAPIPADSGLTEPTNQTEATLAGIWAEVLGLDEVGIDEDFFELGGDSILSIRIIARANQAGIHIAPKLFFDVPTIRGLAALAASPQPKPATENDTGPPTGPIPLLPIHHWFFEHVTEDPQHWNQAAVLKVQAGVDQATLTKGLAQVFAHHDGLRLRFACQSSGQWTASLGDPNSAPPVEWIDLSVLPESYHDDEIARVEDREHAHFDLTTGPLLRAFLFERGQGRSSRLLLILHHLVIDGVSWPVFLEDLETACTQLHRQEGVQLPPKSASFRSWTSELSRWAGEDRLREELPFWLREHAAGEVRLPLDEQSSLERNLRGVERTLTVGLDRGTTTSLLREVPEAYRTQVNDALLTALLLAFSTWTGHRSLLLDLEGHGREPDRLADGAATLDLSRTVGWLTIVYPVPLELPPQQPGQSNPGTALKAIKEQLRAVPHRGIDHGVLLYLGTGPDPDSTLSRRRRPEVVFNYLGQRTSSQPGALFSQIRGARPSARSERASRPYLLEIDAEVEDGTLRVHWTYSPQIHKPETIETVAHNFLNELRTLIEHCVSGAGGVTPSDFPLANLDQGDLDHLSKLLGDDGSKEDE